MSDILLEVEGLTTEIGVGEPGERAPVRAVDGLDLRIRRGETFALLGESGCGKSVTALSLMRLLPPAGRITGGSVQLRRHRSAASHRGPDARGAGRAHGHDLPGAPDLAEPGADHR